MWNLRFGRMCLMFLLLGCGGESSLSPASEVSRQALADPLLEKLQALPGVTVVEVPSCPGVRYFFAIKAEGLVAIAPVLAKDLVPILSTDTRPADRKRRLAL